MENCGRFVFYSNIYIFTKNRKQSNRHCVTCYVISMVYTLIDHSSRPISVREFASQILRCTFSVFSLPIPNWVSRFLFIMRCMRINWALRKNCWTNVIDTETWSFCLGPLVTLLNVCLFVCFFFFNFNYNLNCMHFFCQELRVVWEKSGDCWSLS